MVTGGTRGIGADMAIALAEAGADTILIQVTLISQTASESVDTDKLQRDESNCTTKQTIEGLGRKASIYTCDLASDQDVSELTARVLKDGHDPSILVTCAGIQRRHPSHVFPKHDWDEVSHCCCSLLNFLVPLLTLHRYCRLIYPRSSPYAGMLGRTCSPGCPMRAATGEALSTSRAWCRFRVD